MEELKRVFDISIHFQINNQSIEYIDGKLQKWLDSDSYKGQFDFSEKGENGERNVLHHCFLKAEELPSLKLSKAREEEIEETFDFLEMFSDDIARWRGVSNFPTECLNWDRRLMLENIKKLNGISLFIGEISGGVKEEYDIAIDLGVSCILIK